MNFNRLFSRFYTNIISISWDGRRRARRAASLAALALAAAAVCASSINAQQRPAEPQPEQPAIQSSASEMGNAKIIIAEKDYRISAGDVIQLQIEDAPELSHNYRVNSTGYIEMPVLGLVEAQRRTTFELARQIAKGLRDQEYLNTPSVLVTIKQYNSQTFLVQGSVRSPGIFQTEGRPSVLTMIAMAGGLTENHGPTAYILRPNKTNKPAPERDTQISSLQDQTPDPDQSTQTQAGGSASTPAEDPDYELIKVNLSALNKGQFDQRVEPGDIINIPRADVFYVTGEVKSPGSFTLKEGTTLRQAVSLAQGLTFNAKASRGVIFREDPSLGSRKEIKVDIRDIINGKEDDIPLQANDVVIVPNSRTKSIGGMLLQALGVNSARLPIRY